MRSARCTTISCADGSAASGCESVVNRLLRTLAQLACHFSSLAAKLIWKAVRMMVDALTRMTAPWGGTEIEYSSPSRIAVAPLLNSNLFTVPAELARVFSLSGSKLPGRGTHQSTIEWCSSYMRW